MKNLISAFFVYRKRYIFTSVLFIFLFPFGAINDLQAQNNEAELDSLVLGFDTDTTPGAVVAILRDGKIETGKAYGMANLTHSVPITLDTKFNLGSVSKQFTAFAIALLAKRDSLSLDDPIQKYLTEIPEFEEKVTIKNLLTHTSGLRESYYPSVLKGIFPGQDHLTRQEAIDVVVNQPELEFKPGSEFTYNSSGYVLLAEIIERITEQPFSEWMQTNVFDPLKMNDTVIEMETEQVIPGAADSYKDAENDGYVTDFSNRAYYGAADIYTTVGDMAKWINNFDEATVGGKEIIDQMTAPYVLTTGETSEYGLGLDISKYRGLKKIFHNGAHAGYRAYFSYFPELNAGVVFMQNYSPIPLLLGPAVEDIFFGDQMEPKKEQRILAKSNKEEDKVKIMSSLLEKYEGTYRDVEGFVAFRLEKRKDDLVMQIADNELPFFAVADTVFGSEAVPFQVVFEPNTKNKSTHGYIRAGEDYHFEKVKAHEYSTEDLKTYKGTYYSPELESFQKIISENGELFVVSPREEPVLIKGFEKDYFDALKDDFIIRFKRDQAGNLEGFYISEGRTRNIWFKRERGLEEVSSVVPVKIKGYTFLAPDEIPYGWTTLSLTNTSNEPHLMMAHKLPTGTSPADATASLENWKQNKEPADWWSEPGGRFGGQGLLSPGETGFVTIFLEPGIYSLVCGFTSEDGAPHFDKGVPSYLRVTGEFNGVPEPTADYEIFYEDGSITTDKPVEAGLYTFKELFDDWHDVQLARLNNNSTTKDIKDWLPKWKSPTPTSFIGGLEPLEPGRTAYFTIDITPGKYAWVCSKHPEEQVIESFTIR